MAPCPPRRPSQQGGARRPPCGGRAREAAILAATRTLFDERGVAEAQIEDVARAVGINRAIVYRHFTGKEELFALTLVGYLDELAAGPDRGPGERQGPPKQLAAIVSAFVDYGVAHPAFVDCAHSLMRRPGTELFDEISEGAMLRLGRGDRGLPASCCAGHSRPGVESRRLQPSRPRAARQHALRHRARRPPARPGRPGDRRVRPRRARTSARSRPSR